ncbi:MAG: hypothetical protein RMI30_04055 [Thermodesulfovibrio sp.]|nr:hypothetical protein [Thermodesulfovibrio sp.]MDW7998609.1 hypothetical protein [Thermodesulfovibrio sp.]
MPREFKISLLIFIVFTLILIITIKLKEPSFVTTNERTIAEYPLPDFSLKERSLFSHNYLNNPFSISKVAEIGKEVKESLSAEETSLPLLSFIYVGRYKYAVLGNSIVREGDSINGYKIKAILKDRVLIKDKKGETKWLKLENY